MSEDTRLRLPDAAPHTEDATPASPPSPAAEQAASPDRGRARRAVAESHGPSRAKLALTTAREGWESFRPRLRWAGEQSARFVPLTRLGWATLVTAAVAGWVWWRFGWIEAQVIAIAGLLLVALGLVLAIGRRAYEVTVRLGSLRLSVGQPAVGEIALRNASRRSTGASMVELPVGRGNILFRAPRLAPGAEHTELFRIPTMRRGVIRVGPVMSVRGDSVGLVRREQHWTQPQDVYVHPRSRLLDATVLGFIRDIEGSTTQDLSSSDVSFHALREYVPGDDRRHIHWRTTARTGRMMVRQFEETRRSHLLVLLDLRPAAYGTPDEFEDAVSTAASIGLSVLREQRQMSIFTADGLLHTPSSLAVLDRLTEVELNPRATSLAEVASEAAEKEAGASSVVLVTGSAAPISDLHAAHVRLPLDIAAIGVRLSEGSPLTRNEVQGLPVLTVGTLDDMALGLRKVLS